MSLSLSPLAYLRQLCFSYISLGTFSSRPLLPLSLSRSGTSDLFCQEYATHGYYSLEESVLDLRCEGISLDDILSTFRAIRYSFPVDTLAYRFPFC
jgi:hypothetical protein